MTTSGDPAEAGLHKEEGAREFLRSSGPFAVFAVVASFVVNAGEGRSRVTPRRDVERRPVEVYALVRSLAGQTARTQPASGCDRLLVQRRPEKPNAGACKRSKASVNQVREDAYMAKTRERKPKVSAASVEDFIDAQDSEQVRDDCHTLVALMEKATGAKAEMWGHQHRRLRPLPVALGERQAN